MINRSNSNEYVIKKFRDSLIIDRFDPLIDVRRKKFHIKSHDIREDSLVWNIFRTLNHIERSTWIQPLFEQSFFKDFLYRSNEIEIKLWKKLWPARSLQSVEGALETDIIIESEEFVWLIEVKYFSDIFTETKSNYERDEIIRNIDIGTAYAKKRDFYFSLLILDRFHSPNGYRYTTSYRDQVNKALEKIKYRQIQNLKGISLITWKEMQSILKTIYLYSKRRHEKFIADQAASYLLEKIKENDI